MAAMDKASWAAMSAALDELLEADERQRAIRLTELRGRDPALADEVARLLREQHAIEAEHFLEGTACALRRENFVGQHVAAYTLERPLGEGGMGAVWLARRTDGRHEGRA